MTAETCGVVHACGYTTPTPEWLEGAPLFFLNFVARVGWGAALAIYTSASWRHESYRGIPPSALFFIINWLVVYQFVLAEHISVIDVIGSIISVVACVLQIGQYYKYKVAPEVSTFLNGEDKRERVVAFSRLVWRVELFVTMVGLFFSTMIGFKDTFGLYGGFGINTYMSTVFLWQLVNNPSQAANTDIVLLPAVLRCVASLAASIVSYGQVDHNAFLLIQYVSIFVLDVTFIIVSAIMAKLQKGDDCEKLTNEDDCDYVPLVCTAVVENTNE